MLLLVGALLNAAGQWACVLHGIERRVLGPRDCLSVAMCVAVQWPCVVLPAQR